MESLQPSHPLPFVLSRSYPLLPSASPIPTLPARKSLQVSSQFLFIITTQSVARLDFLFPVWLLLSFSQSFSWLNYPLSFLLPPGCRFSTTKELSSYTQSARLALSSGKGNNRGPPSALTHDHNPGSFELLKRSTPSLLHTLISQNRNLRKLLQNGQQARVCPDGERRREAAQERLRRSLLEVLVGVLDRARRHRCHCRPCYVSQTHIISLIKVCLIANRHTTASSLPFPRSLRTSSTMPSSSSTASR